MKNTLSQRKSRSSLSCREKWIAGTLIPIIMVPPWFLGGMRWWQQLIFLGLAILPFILCFLPFAQDDTVAGGARPSVGLQRSPFKRLFRFPPFWLTILFLIYIIIGALNYSWECTVVNEGKQWKMVKLPAEDYIQWLPSGVKAPFERMDAWRAVIIYVTGLLLVCSVWLGIERRRTLWFLIGVLGFNAFLVALLTILQDLSSTKLIYWTFESANRNFAGPFQYRNHGGAYMYLGLSCCFGCAFYYWRRGRRGERKSNPAPLFLFFAFVILCGILFAGSRGGILFGGLITVFAALFFIGSAMKKGKEGLFYLGGVTMILVIVCCLFWSSIIRSFPEIEKRYEQTKSELALLGTDPNKTNQRMLLAKATFEMWEAKNWFGWGAGSYRWMFPRFQQKYPELFYTKWSLKFSKKNPEHVPLRRVAVYNAHSDPLQFLAEYGVLGTSILGGVLGFYYVGALLRLVQMKIEIMLILAGTVLLCVHSLFDFLFFNPACLFAFSFILSIAWSSSSQYMLQRKEAS